MISPRIIEHAHHAQAILPPYTRDHETKRHRVVKRWLIGAVVIFCFGYGLAFAFLAPFAIPIFAIPLAVMAMLVIWALPHARSAPTGTLETLIFFFMACLIVWPNYIAFSPPGMPWITMVRLTGFPLAFVLLICVSISIHFRSAMLTALRTSPWIWKLFCAFTVLEFLSIALSKNKIQSLDKFVIAQISWTAVFFTSAYVFMKAGSVERMAKLLWATAIVVGLIALAEARVGHVLWSGHIPRFLKIDDPAVIATLAGHSRAADGRYRAIGTFTTPLALGECMALILPLVVQFAISPFSKLTRTVAAASSIFVLYVAFISGSRLGLIGCLLAFLFHGAIWAAFKWRRSPHSLIGPAVALIYPLLFSVAISSIFLVGRVRHLIWGSGSQQFSDQARQDQWSLGIPKILNHPFGGGIGMGAEILGYNPAGTLSIDSYYLSVFLEYGILGFFIFFGIFMVAIYSSLTVSWKNKIAERESDFLPAIAVSLANFFIVKSVFSQQENHPLVFMMLGMVVALVYRIKAGNRPGAVDAGYQN